jgi:glycosyltransferase involved in cell wall biosynthesis
MSFKFLVVIPTRNRAEFAINAVRSVLAQKGADFEIVVSDNSTDEASLFEVQQYCSSLQDDRVTYITPPEPLPMTKHWEWAMQTVLAQTSFTHVTYLTDRNVFKRDAFRQLASVTERFPDKLIAYRPEAIYGSDNDLRLEQIGTTGRLFEIRSADLVDAFLKLDWVSIFPAMLNSCVPRRLIEEIASEHGEVFSSISPDFNFGFKVLDLEDSILYFDETLLVTYGLTLSNGLNFTKGRRSNNEASVDFANQIDKSDIHIDSLLPFCSTILDAVLNEYFFIEKNAKRRKFPKPDSERYRSYVIRNVLHMDQGEFRDEALRELKRKLGSSFHTLALRGRFPLARYGRRIYEELLIRTMRLSETSEIKDFDDLASALDYAMSHSAPQIANLNNFYKRTTFVPSKAIELSCGGE